MTLGDALQATAINLGRKELLSLSGGGKLLILKAIRYSRWPV